MIEWIRLQDDHFLHIVTGTRVLIAEGTSGARIRIYYPAGDKTQDRMESFDVDSNDASRLRNQLQEHSIPASFEEARV